MVTLENVSKQYKNFTLEPLNLTVPSGSILGIIGENGAGKTTLIKTMLDIVHRDSGRVEIFGKDFDTHREEILQDVAVVFDGNTFYEKYTAQMIENIYRRMYQRWDSTLYHEYLSEFSIDPKQRIEEYSKGMKMKLSIASALAHRPKLLVLDEATSGLDPVVRREVLDIFQAFILNEEHSVIFSSHITSDLEKVADYVAFLRGGALEFVRSKDELLYDFGVVQVGKSDFSKIQPEDYIRYRMMDYGVQLLVSSGKEWERKYNSQISMAFERPTIDEIMLLYIKGVK